MLEAALVRALASRFLFKRQPNGDDDFEEVFYSVRAPLGTFAARIKVGRLIGIYAFQVQNMLDAVRRIRNVFAHSVRPITFDHELIHDELDDLPDAVISGNQLRALGYDPSQISPQRMRYLGVCLNLAGLFEAHAKKYEGQQITVDLNDGPAQRKPLPRKSS